jgi:3-oxoacyl-[acyl-carrier protein] reductase
MPVESALAVSKVFAGFENIKLLICAHGIYGEAARVEDSDPWLWRHALEVNLLGTYNVCRFALPKMARNGLIINLAGGGGMLDPLPFISSYGCSKAGIVSLTKTLAAEHPDLRVNCIFPGMQDGEIHDRLLAAGKEGNPAYQHIKKMRESGEGAIPVERTLALIDRLLLDRRITGKILFARTGAIQ